MKAGRVEQIWGFGQKRKRIIYTFLIIILATSFLNLAGWIFDLPLLRGDRPGWTNMKPATSLCFILASVSVIILQKERRSAGRRAFILLSIFILVAIGVITIYEYMAVISTGNESSLSTMPVLRLVLQSNLRPALITSMLFVMTALMLGLLHHKRLFGLVHILALLNILVNYFVPMSYVTGIRTIFIVSNIPVALNTGVNFILLGSVILLAYPSTWLTRVFLDRYAGGNMARRLIPGIVILPFIVTWLRLKGEQAGIFNSETGIVLVGVTYTFCLLLLVWVTAKRVIKIDKIQRSLNAELEEKAHFISTITETFPDVISIVELPSRKLLYINRDSFSEQGFDAENFPEMTFEQRLNLIHPDDRIALDNYYDELSKTEKDEIITLEYRVKNKTGEWTWCRARSKVFERVNGEVKSCINIVQNVMAEKESELRLVASEARFRMLADNISQLVWILDEHGRYVWFNKQWFDYTGVTLEEMQNGALSRIIHPDYLRNAAEGFRQAMEQGESWKDIFPMRNRNGEFRWFLNQAVPIPDQSGKLIQWFGTNTDIHEQKTAEDKAVLLATQLEAILVSTPVGVVVYDENLSIMKWNSAAMNILQYDSREFNMPYAERATTILEVRRSDGTLLKPEEFPAYRAVFNSEVILNEVLLVIVHGKTVWLSLSAAPYIVEGRYTGCVLSLTDITEAKRAEEAVLRSRERLRAITDNSPDVIARFDRNLKHTFINPYGEKVYGKSRSEIIGKSSSDLGMPEDKIAFWKKNFEEVLSSGQQKHVEFEFDSPVFGKAIFSFCICTRERP